MKFNEYNLSNSEGKSNCVIRSFCKMFNLTYDDVYNELCTIQKELNANSYNDIEVFETFMNKRNVESIEYGKEMKIKNLKLDDGSYIVFCWNKDEFYHMIPIINNVIYDRDNRCMELYVLNIYKQKELVKK